MNFKGTSYPEILPDIINEKLDAGDAMFFYFIELKGGGLVKLFSAAEESIEDPGCSLAVSKEGVSIHISIKKDAGVLLCPKNKDEAAGLLTELLSACNGFDAAKKLLVKEGKKISSLTEGIEWLAIDLDYSEYFYQPTRDKLMNKINKMIDEYGSRKVAALLEDDLDLILSDYEGPVLREFDELAMEEIVDEDELPIDEDIERLIEEEEETEAFDDYEDDANLAWDDVTGFDFEEYADAAAETYCDENRNFENCAVCKEFVFSSGESYYYSRDELPSEL